jgi:hypothetical protein
MGDTISLADLKAQLTPKPLKFKDKLVVPKEMTKPTKPKASDEAKPSGETYGSTTKKTISLEALKRQVEGVKPEQMKPKLSVI